MDLLLNRGDNFAISEFKTIKINGREVQPYVMRFGEAIFVRTLSSDGDTTTHESKLRSNLKFGVFCNTKAAVPPQNVQAKSGVFLSSGEAVFAWLLEGDQEAAPYVIDGQSQTVFICDPKTNSNSGARSPGASTSSTRTETVH